MACTSVPCECKGKPLVHVRSHIASLIHYLVMAQTGHGGLVAT